MKNFKIILILFVTIIFLSGCNLVVKPVNNVNLNQNINQPVQNEFNFFATGNMVKNNPGLKPDTWYLVYEEPGAPALTMELKFDQNSKCNVENTQVLCASINSADFFQQGEQVTVKGTKSDSLVLVAEVTKQPINTSAGSQTVTLADNNKTITLKIGETFLLNLGEFYNWDISISDQNIISRVVNILVIRGAQGVYKAKTAGTVTLSATGTPTCYPQCLAPSILFKLNIEVK
ncbi:MAG: hypothetical protein WC460_01615 [Patescibacteria group bacterium]